MYRDGNSLIGETPEEIAAISELAEYNTCVMKAETGEIVFGKGAGNFMIQHNEDHTVDLVACDHSAELALAEICRGNGNLKIRQRADEGQPYKSCMSLTLERTSAPADKQLRLTIHMRGSEIDRDKFTLRPRIFDPLSSRYAPVEDPDVLPVQGVLLIGNTGETDE